MTRRASADKPCGSRGARRPSSLGLRLPVPQAEGRRFEPSFPVQYCAVAPADALVWVPATIASSLSGGVYVSMEHQEREVRLLLKGAACVGVAEVIGPSD